MDNTNKRNFNQKAHIADAASELLNEGKKYANELYADGISKVNEAEEQIKEQVKDYTDQLSKKVKANPLASVLMAAGIGFLLSKILK